MASQPASIIATGTRVPYHTTSRARLPDVTADALRSAAVRLPAESLRPSGVWFVRELLKLYPEARQLLQHIMGGTRRAVPYDVSGASRSTILRAAEAGTMRRAMASTMNLDSMGFADPTPDGFADPTPDGPSPGPMALGELDHGHGGGSARARDSAGRYVSASDESTQDPRALRDSEPDPRDLRESGPTTDADGRALRASGTPPPG